jgi:hypothetical protein
MPRVPSASTGSRGICAPDRRKPAPAKAGGALLLVDAKPQAAFQEPPHRGHDPFARRRRPHMDVAVIGPRVRPLAGPRTGATAELVVAWAFSPRTCSVEGRDPFPRWAPAFAGVAVFSGGSIGAGSTNETSEWI